MKNFFLLPILVLFPMVLVSCTSPEVDEEAIGVEVITVPSPEADGTVQHKEFGQEEWLAIGAVSGVGDIPANGVAQSHYFQGTTYIHTVNVNLNVAETGSYYEGWLLDPATQSRISTGRISPIMADARHFLKFQSTDDLRAYTVVQITKEADDGNAEPSTVIAQGTLVRRER